MKPSKPAEPIQADISFEQAVGELETIVSQMELGKLALDDAFSAYKRGAALLQICQQSLNHVEQQVRVLTEAQNLAPFQTNDE